MRVESLDKLENMKKYLKYIIISVPIIIVIIIILAIMNNDKYSKLEKAIVKEALLYIEKKQIVINKEQYLLLTDLNEFDGIEMCSKASGVILKQENGKLSAKAYLKCSDYESNVIKNKSSFINLNGEEVVILNKGEVFNDPLYEKKKECEVKVSGYVGTESGIYTLKYDILVNNKFKGSLERKVIISENDKTQTISGLTSTSEPKLELLGDETIILNVGSKYVEPGYKAYDYKDGKISRDVEVSDSKINTSKEGTYVITYKVKNSKGNEAKAYRTIKIVKFKGNIELTLNVTNEELAASTTIEYKVNNYDDTYSKLVLPNGSLGALEGTYLANYNGNYKFKIYDIYGNEFIKQINIDNLDNEAPSGTCVASVIGQATNILVNASDNKGISGYNYIIDSEESNFISSNSYTTSKNVKNVSVIVKDIVDNQTTLQCSISTNWDKKCFTQINIPKTYSHRLNGHQTQEMPFVNTKGQLSNKCEITVEGSNDIIIGGVNSAGAYYTPKNYGVAELTTTYKNCMCDGSTVTQATKFTIHEWGLKTLSVSGGTLTPSFNNMITNYTVYISSSPTTVKISATPNDFEGSVSGTGSITVSNGTTITITSKTRIGTKTKTRLYFVKK